MWGHTIYHYLPVNIGGGGGPSHLICKSVVKQYVAPIWSFYYINLKGSCSDFGFEFAKGEGLGEPNSDIWSFYYINLKGSCSDFGFVFAKGEGLGEPNSDRKPGTL